MDILHKIFFIFLLVFSSPAYGFDFVDKFTFTKKAIELKQSGDEDALLLHLGSADTKAEQLASMNVLQKVILEGATNPNFYSLYAVQLWKGAESEADAKLQKELQIHAIAEGLAALYITQIDAARCADKTAGGGDIMKLQQVLAPLLSAIDTLTEEEKALVNQTAKDLENRIVHRVPNRKPCLSGMSAMIQALEHKEDGKVKWDSPNENTHVFQDSPIIKIDFVSQEEWLARRKKIRRD